MLNIKLSISALFEYSNIAHGMVTNIRLQYNPKEGNDLYLVYNEGRNIELNRVTPLSADYAISRLLNTIKEPIMIWYF